MNSPIKLIAFDLFGVVITEGHMVSKALMPLLPNGTDKKRVKSFYYQYTLGQINEDDFWAGIGHSDNSLLRQGFLDTFELDPDIEAVKVALQNRFKLAILSNLASDWSDVLSKKFNFDRDYSPKIVSGEVKCGKPDMAIYHHLLEQSGHKPEEVAFIDDRLENLHTANQLGMTTIHYRREEDLHAYKADYVIKRLGEIKQIEIFNMHNVHI